jgi:hypothetical protein
MGVTVKDVIELGVSFAGSGVSSSQWLYRGKSVIESEVSLGNGCHRVRSVYRSQGCHRVRGGLESRESMILGC